MGSFTLSTVREDSHAIIRTNGYINDLGGEQIDEECTKLLNHGINIIIINFENSKIINSIGISILIGVIEKIREKKATLIFSNLSEVNEETFKMMGLAKFATIYKTEEEALNKL